MRYLVFLALVGLVSFHALPQAKPKMVVYKTATCGCCGKWVEHVQAAGFDAKVVTVAATAAARKNAGIPEAYASCHTAVVGGYAIEGHVPATDILRLLKEKPKAKGLAVPGMPIGSPGMEAGARKDTYQTFLIQADGSTKVFAKH
ncbi:MAG: DUF411 domain-containing protein [Bryobacter sp.]|nr:DUF411 domain-containing protein [Bryobacter sp.]